MLFIANEERNKKPEAFTLRWCDAIYSDGDNLAPFPEVLRLNSRKT